MVVSRVSESLWSADTLRPFSVMPFLWVLSTVALGAECEPIWEEHFDKPLNRSLWNVVEGDGCAQNLCGWGNNEVQSYDADAVSVVAVALE